MVTKVRYIVPRYPIPMEYPKFRNIHVVPRYPVPMEVYVRVNSAQCLGTGSHSAQSHSTQDQIFPAMEVGYLCVHAVPNMVYEVHETLSKQHQGRLCHALSDNL